MNKTSDGNKYIIGILPGFNSSIDNKGLLEKELLHNVTFLDLVPVTYSSVFLEKLLNNTNNITTTSLYTYKEADNIFQQNFKTLINKYLNEKTSSSSIGLRLILSSDSTYNATFRTDVEENDLFDIKHESKIMNSLSAFSRKVKLTSPEAALESYMTQFQNDKSSLLNFIRGVFDSKIFGVNFALPRIPTNSDYSSELSVFIKLTSPSGHLNAVTEYIVKPLILLLIAASPISQTGITYGFPFMWKATNYGNINYNAAYISSLTITRGSLETSYSDDFLPLSIDVRMTISNLSDRFASILSEDLSVKDELSNVGLYTPGQEIQSLIRDTNLSNTKITSKPKLITINL